MAKQLFLIPVRSMVDVITNSSSQIFVCDTTKSVEIINEMLLELIALYDKHTGESHDFSEMFGEPYLVKNKKEVNHIFG